MECVRIEYARALLRDDAHSIIEIAQRFGYSGAHTFRSAVKKQTGLTRAVRMTRANRRPCFLYAKQGRFASDADGLAR